MYSYGKDFLDDLQVLMRKQSGRSYLGCSTLFWFNLMSLETAKSLFEHGELDQAEAT